MSYYDDSPFTPAPKPTRAQRRALRSAARTYTFDRNLGYTTSKWFIQVPYTQRQRMAEWNRYKARQRVQHGHKTDQRLLPWQ